MWFPGLAARQRMRSEGLLTAGVKFCGVVQGTGYTAAPWSRLAREPRAVNEEAGQEATLAEGRGLHHCA